MNGIKYAFRVASSGSYWNPQEPKLYNYNAGSQDDVFLDDTYKDSSSGVVSKVNLPSRYANNPVFLPLGQGGSDTYDKDKEAHTVLKIGSQYVMWYTAVASDLLLYVARAVSNDGITWTKPIYNLVDYGGNTNNNLIQENGRHGPSVIYDPTQTADKLYLSGQEDWGPPTIWKSSDGISEFMTVVKQLVLAGAVYSEGKELIRRPDAKYLFYYTWKHSTQERQVGVWLSDSDDPAGTWTDQGTIINTEGLDNQKYDIAVIYNNGIYYGFVSKFNKATEQIFGIDLYTSRDGLTFTRCKVNYMGLGSAGAWDDEMMIVNKDFIREANDWRFYYTGWPVNHASAFPRDCRGGFATIGYKKLGNIEGNGTWVTKAFTPTDVLKVIAWFPTGSMKVELLDASDDSVLAGYSKNDMDSLPKTCNEYEVKWGGNSIRTDISLKIKFYLYSDTPQSLTATVVSGPSIKLDWTNIDTDGDGVTIERSLDGVTYVKVGIVGLGVATFTDTTAVSGEYYYYRIYAFDGSVKSGYSNVVYQQNVLTPLVLDTYTGAAYGLSLRKLSNAYSGYCIKVKRSSDGTEQDIGFKADNWVDDVAITTFCGAGSGYVTKWYDQSGNNRDLSEATNPPTIFATGTLVTLSGKPIIRLVVGEGLTAVNYSIAQKATKFEILAANFTNATRLISYGGGASSQSTYMLNPAGKYSIDAGVTLSDPTTGKNDGSLSKLFSVFYSWWSDIALNGGGVTSGNTSTGAMDNLKIGYLALTSPGDAYYGELLYYPSDQTANKTAIETDMDDYWEV